MAKKQVKKKLNLKGLFVVLLTLYLLIMLFYYVFTMPIKTIVINGNNVLTEEDIINAAEISDYPSLFKTSYYSLKKKISSLDLVESVEIKKSLTGKLTINVVEEKVLFFNKSNDKYVLSNNKEIDMTKSLLGVPTLVNFTPSDIYENLIKRLSKIDSDVISCISEINYSPDIKNNITFDENRFLLRMNDGNSVYINIANFEKLNQYKKIWAAVQNTEETKMGVFYLDSSREDTILFSTYEAIKNGEEGVNVELPE